MKIKYKILNSSLLKIYRWYFGKCDYCGNFIKNGGGRKLNGGTPHYVYESLPNGMPSDKEKIKYCCLKCEMDFDED